ncbi:HAD hydrolase-like protein [Streptomyces sp. NPDC091215]|uniref:HAD hydrolase-like protein n=1 Tax=Streptomyces sp. NPDC091215 TaxID=3155192 RepID=UPI0034152E66
MTPTCLLLDLDGTLVDSAPGITGSVTAALMAVGAPVPDADTLRSFVGPPMYQTFREVVGLDEPTAKRALRFYRAEYARTGALDSRVYDGVPALLEILESAGLPMAVATSKVEDQAVRITEHYGLAKHMVTVCGTSDAAGRSDKTEVIRECLRRLRRQGVDISRPLMVGDRGYDVLSAADVGIPTIRVLWGYGAADESARACATVDSPRALVQRLLSSGEAEDGGLLSHHHS